MKKIFHILFNIFRWVLKILYLYYWVIPIRFGMLAFIVYFGLIYLFYGTIQVSEIKMILDKNETTFFIFFWLPFAVPLFLSLGACFGSSGGSKNSPLEDAIKYRNGQMNVSSDKEASKILRQTAYLDMLNSNDSEVFDSARRGFNANYGASSPSTIFKDMMKNDENSEK